MAIRRRELAATTDFNTGSAMARQAPAGVHKADIRGRPSPRDFRATMIFHGDTSIKLRFLLLFLTLLPSALPAQAGADASGKPFAVEYYYKAKWGYADEFLQLFKKNHYPLLKKQVEMGRMLKVWMDQPRYHTQRKS